VLGSVLPFLGGLIEAGAFIFALALSVPLTLVTIALAWFAHRPILGCGLIAAAVAVYFLLGARHSKAKTA
jgi:transmembrane protein TMEM43